MERAALAAAAPAAGDAAGEDEGRTGRLIVAERQFQQGNHAIKVLDLRPCVLF